MKKIRAGIVGLGRLGRHYAENLVFKVAGVELVAACSLVEEERGYASRVLGVPETYAVYENMLDSASMDVVFVISSTDQHASHMSLALEAGLHVFCEKPLALDVATCLSVERVADAHPGQFAVVGFVRRFDPSYAYARQKIDGGVIGTPFLVKSQTVDMDDQAPFQLEFVKKSGGLFHDFNVHDIDLARWYLGANVASVFATGGAYKHEGFAALWRCG